MTSATAGRRNPPGIYLRRKMHKREDKYERK
jgi:hypothetical protein